jgi:multidrug efflux pump subunit AcrA (membrane-fusion protein)
MGNPNVAWKNLAFDNMIGAFDPNSRTLLLEIDVPNPDGRLYAGMYAHAKFLLPTPTPALLIQDNTIPIDAKESRVVIVDFSNKIHVASLDASSHLPPTAIPEI